MAKLSSTAPLALVSAKPIDLEKLPGSEIGNSFRFEADNLGKIALAMLEHVDGLRSERAKKGTLAGVYLQQVKAALGHGPFEEWCRKHLGKSTRMARYYMALAAKFSRSARLLLPEIIGANQLSLALEAKGSDAVSFKAKLDKFVGDKGLTELMQKHGVLKRGGARPKQEDAAGDQEGDEEPNSLSPEALAYQQMSDAVKAAEAALLDPVRWSLLSPEAAEKIEPLVKRLTTRFHERLLQARHEHAAA